MTHLAEPLTNLFANSKKLILDFSQIDSAVPDNENVEKIFEDYLKAGKNPRQPDNRQEINNRIIHTTGFKYLIGQYGEDRQVMLADTPAGKQGRTMHMAIDVFCENLEPVYAPCDGTIVRSDYEAGFGEYGHYLILQPTGEKYYVFFGHLADKKHPVGPVKKGDEIARLGDFHNTENGGWSRHLHIQILRKLPEIGITPNGYASKKEFKQLSEVYPDPILFFTDWVINS